MATVPADSIPQSADDPGAATPPQAISRHDELMDLFNAKGRELAGWISEEEELEAQLAAMPPDDPRRDWVAQKLREIWDIQEPLARRIREINLELEAEQAPASGRPGPKSRRWVYLLAGALGLDLYLLGIVTGLGASPQLKAALPAPDITAVSLVLAAAALLGAVAARHRKARRSITRKLLGQG